MIRGTRSAALVAAAVMGSMLAITQAGARDAARPDCSAPSELTRLPYALTHTAARIAAGDPLTIVAIGSSSTAGAGASSPAASYPSRLAVELQKVFPRSRITVFNRGVNGEETGDMLARFDGQVIAAKPDLVIWQLGTNAVLRDRPLDSAVALIRDGLRRIKAAGADVVLIDPQYAPKVIAKRDSEGMVNLISLAAKEDSVDLFPRYAVMRDWRDHQGIPFETFVSPDGIHMNDWSYACLAKLLGRGIAEAATRASAPAQVAGGRKIIGSVAH
ncbi:MAG TPA: GDSL-type esterase/lipase family protein [Xanthobacteraceae bacterium]|jgi:lysophospholipase L1-like esterase|nr:GDSL-type esterase/lipase family protein [Xanthobacteraceae bacterium]